MMIETIPTRTALQTVLEIPELLESIILQLPLMEILTTASRVSRQWNNVIQASPLIQQSFFFQPRTNHVVRPDRIDPDTYFGWRPIALPTYSQSSVKYNPIISWSGLSGDDDTNEIQKIPWRGTNPHNAHGPGKRRFHLVRYLNGWKDPEYLDCPAAECLESSWRRMFLTDPPCSAVLVKIGSIDTRLFYDLDFHGCTQLFTAWDPRGVKLGLIEELTRTAFALGDLELPGPKTGHVWEDAEILLAMVYAWHALDEG